MSEPNEKQKLSDYITRDMYRQIKSMNREGLCEFLFSLYKSIYEDYEAKILNINYDKIKAEVTKIRGIGDVKAEQIVEIVKTIVNEKDS